MSDIPESLLQGIEYSASIAIKRHDEKVVGHKAMVFVNAFDVLELCVEIRKLRAEREAHG